MILVDVYVPSMDRVYNFNLDEDSSIQVIIDEISDLICKKEHSTLEGEQERFVMGSIDQCINFLPTCSLREYQIHNGDRLILV